MTAVAWVLCMVLVVAVTLIVMGMALRPYVAELQQDRNAWRLRAEVAEAEIEQHIGSEVRLIPIDAQADLDVFLKGVTDEI